MAKNVNFFKIFSLVTTVLSTVAKLVKEFVESNKLDDEEINE